MNIHVILFQNFETLDVFGSVEVFGKVDGFTLRYYSLQGGAIKNTDNLVINTLSLGKIELSDKDVLFIPGGLGTRVEISNPLFIERLTQLSIKSKYVLTVCTGSALLAKTGQLDGVRATSNKRSFEWVKSISEKVEWIPQARWVVDDKFYTSSGISAGIDMALSFVRDVCSENIAREIACRIEYEWQEDSTKDNFYIQN